MPNQNDIAWAAGLFEGEGCIQNHTTFDPRDGGEYLRVRLCLQSTDRDVVDRLGSVLGGCATDTPVLLPSGKTAYKWRSKDRLDTIRIIKMLLPNLGERRTAKAIEAVDAIRIREGTPRRIRKDKKP